MDKVNLTGKLIDQSINAVRSVIQAKNSPHPFLSNGSIVKKSLIDMDHHPYTRWYRGVYYYPDPIVMEREAGWRPIEQQCYSVNVTYEVSEPENCFESACTTTYPCFPNNNRFEDKTKLNTMIQDNCIVQYR